MQGEHDCMMDLRRLGHLVALADERHFARAAMQVHLSQPAFSRSIQALERDMGLRLFERETGEVRPTPAGAFLIDRARRLLFDARCLQRDAELYAQSQLGDARFGAGPFPMATLMPEVLPELRRRHPLLHFSVEVGGWVQLLELLRAERIEFFVAEVRSLPLDATLDVLSIGRQHGGLFVRNGHPLAGQTCTLAEAWACGVAMTQVAAVMKAALAALLKLPPGQDPPVALACDDLSLLRESIDTPELPLEFCKKLMGDLGFEPRTNGLRVRCAAIAPVTLILSAFYSFNIMSDFLTISKSFLRKDSGR